MDLSSIAIRGLQQAEAQLEKTATKVASWGGNSLDGAAVDTVDLSVEMVALMSAANQFSVNLSTLKTAEQVQKKVIDLLA